MGGRQRLAARVLQPMAKNPMFVGHGEQKGKAITNFVRGVRFVASAVSHDSAAASRKVMCAYTAKYREANLAAMMAKHWEASGPQMPRCMFDLWSHCVQCPQVHYTIVHISTCLRVHRYHLVKFVLKVPRSSCIHELARCGRRGVKAILSAKTKTSNNVGHRLVEMVGAHRGFSNRLPHIRADCRGPPPNHLRHDVAPLCCTIFASCLSPLCSCVCIPLSPCLSVSMCGGVHACMCESICASHVLCFFLSRSRFGKMAAKRNRAQCTAEGLAGIITPFVNGRRWLSYADNANSKINRVLILSHKGLIMQIMDEYKTINLAATVTDASFALIAEDIGDRIGLKEEHKKDWARTMSKRLRAMLRHTAQSMVKRCAWTEKLFAASPPEDEEKATTKDNENDEEHEEEKAVKDLEVEPGCSTEPLDTSWVVGFSWEHFEAWRTRLTSGRGVAHKQTTKDLYSNDDNDASPMIARWPDGFCATLPELLQGQWRSAKRLQTRKTTKTPTAVLTAPRRSNGHIVKVAYRSERPGQENYRIMEGAQTVTIIQLNKFKGDDAAAKQLAIELATELVNEDITKADLVRRRDQRLPKQEKKKKVVKEQEPEHEQHDATATTTGATTPVADGRSPRSPAPEPHTHKRRRMAHDMSAIPRGLMSSSEEWTPRTP